MAAKIVDYTPASVESEWAEDAQALADLPEGKAIVIEGNRGARTAFQRAAREAGVTARCVNTEIVTESEGVNGKGEAVDTSVYAFTFIARELRTRKTKGDVTAPEAEADDTK